MLSKRLFAILSMIVALSLAVLACGGGGTATEAPNPTRTPKATTETEPTDKPDPTAKPKPTKTPTTEDVATPEPDATAEEGIVAGEVAVISLYGYVDEYDYFHMVGLVYNDTEDPATSIELTLTLADGSGDTVLTDSDGNPVDEVTLSPFLYTIAQGETTPFDYYVSTDGADTSDWQGAISVTDYSQGDVDRGEVEVINDTITVDQYGTIYLTGELVNLSDQPVLVNSLAGALLAADGTAVAADASYNLTRYLAPNGDEAGNDRTPFSISLDGPADEADDKAYFVDVDVTDEVDVASSISVDIVNAFVDDFDNLHIFANIGNTSDQVLSISLVAGLYDADGVVVDAATASVPIYVGPGEVIPVSFDYFSAVNGDADLIGNVDSYSIQVDPYWTYETSFETVALETANESSETSDGSVTFTGDVNNTSTEDLSSATLILAIYDTEGNLFSSSWTSVYPEDDTFSAGETLPFEVTLYVPSDVDRTDFTFFTYVQGYVQ